MSDQVVIGKIGLLTSPIIDSQHSGAIMLQVRGGSEEFIAISNSYIAKNTEVIVIAYYEPRTVLVTPTQPMKEEIKGDA